MVIGLDATQLCGRDGQLQGGIGHYTFSILRHLTALPSPHRWVIFVSKNFPRSWQHDLVGDNPRAVVLRPLLPRLPFLSPHVFLPLRLWLNRVQVLFAPSGSLPLLWFGPAVATVHDLAIFEHPEWFDRAHRQSFSTRLVVPRSLRRAQRLIAVSHATAQQLVRLFPETQARVSVVHEGVAPPPGLSERPSIPEYEDTVLFLGTIEPRKNLLNALQAFARYLDMQPARASRTRFLLAGPLGWQTEPVTAAVAALNEQWRAAAGRPVVKLLGRVTEQEKWALLARAFVLLFPSWFEGFGLPLLEAMAAGTPAIVSDRGALPEVGGDCVTVVAPDDLEAMSLALAQHLLVPEGGAAMRAAAKKRAASFTWEEAARRTLEVIVSTV